MCNHEKFISENRPNSFSAAAFITTKRKSELQQQKIFYKATNTVYLLLVICTNVTNKKSTVDSMPGTMKPAVNKNLCMAYSQHTINQASVAAFG